MTDQVQRTNATDLAIRALNEFIDAWIGPTARSHLADHRDLSTVYAAIRAIAPAEQTKGKPYRHERRNHARTPGGTVSGRTRPHCGASA